jgi:hypothetical protein
MAQRIVEYRDKNGAFKKLEDLMNVKGIGEKNFLKLKASSRRAAEALSSPGSIARGARNSGRCCPSIERCHARLHPDRHADRDCGADNAVRDFDSHAERRRRRRPPARRGVSHLGATRLVRMQASDATRMSP